jgi:hypothetical protein
VQSGDSVRGRGLFLGSSADARPPHAPSAQEGREGRPHRPAQLLCRASRAGISESIITSHCFLYCSGARYPSHLTLVISRWTAPRLLVRGARATSTRPVIPCLRSDAATWNDDSLIMEANSKSHGRGKQPTSYCAKDEDSEVVRQNGNSRHRGWGGGGNDNARGWTCKVARKGRETEGSSAKSCSGISCKEKKKVSVCLGHLERDLPKGIDSEVS